MHERYPAVCRLQIHLPNQQSVMFEPDDDDPDMLLADPERKSVTTLMAFFEACQLYPDVTADLLYPDVPLKFTWHPKEREWKPRKANRGTIGRVYFVPPSSGELYYLRILLYIVKGPRSFEALRTYEGIQLDTFKQACAIRGLLDTDEEWDHCLTEAAEFQTGPKLRQLFVNIMIGNSPQDALGLFQRHYRDLTDDISFQLQKRYALNPHLITASRVEQYALYELNRLLQESAGKTVTEFGLPSPPQSLTAIVTTELGTTTLPPVEGLVLREEMQFDRAELLGKWDKGYKECNAGQKHILDTILGSLSNAVQISSFFTGLILIQNLTDSERIIGQSTNDPPLDGTNTLATSSLFFIDGPGGTGKTFTENLLLSYVRGHGHVALSVASSGIAALLLLNGRTAHSRFKIPLQLDSYSRCSVSVQTNLAELFRRTTLIIWDEAPAQHRDCFMAVDRMLRDVRNINKWFGGIPTIFSGNAQDLSYLLSDSY
jgi:hypothetical protein